TSALRDMVAPHTFFEALGVRYAGPIDGHDIDHMEQAFTHAAEWDGPIVVHALTQKGRGYAPAEEDDIQRLHDFKVAASPAPEPPAESGPGVGSDAGCTDPDRHAAVAELPVTTFTDAFTRELLRRAESD